MGILDDVVPISELGQRNLWCIWGKSNSGKTFVAATFPKPLLYVQMGDDGSNTIANVEGIDAKRINTTAELKILAKEIIKDKKYKTLLFDTFSMHTNMWVEEYATSKNKKMTQQMWGDMKAEQEELIRLFHKAALKHTVVVTCHEIMDTVDGMEDEITPDIRPSITKGARTYLEGMCNYGIHTTKVSKEKETEEGTETLIRFACHLGPNPYYWTKLQIDSSIKVPKLVINPTYNKIMKIINGGN
jgi:hypothetical protein